LIEERRRAGADPYVFTREAYLRHRPMLVHDGALPPEETEAEFEGLLLELHGGDGR
jgi:ABC-type transporter lipoprotein component MlaA